jgi:hypothetical protein
MNQPGMVVGVAVMTLLAATAGFAQSEAHQGQGVAVVTVLPKQESALPPQITMQKLSVKVNGKPVAVTDWKPLQNSLEVVLLIDGSARNSLGNQFDTMEKFLRALPPNSKAAVAYMAYGRAVIVGKLSTDHELAVHGLHLPGGLPGSNASPYFCLSDLAKNWPSADRSARREVVMVTDGVDNYERQFNPDDPYVEAAISDSVRAGVVVDSIYWLSTVVADSSLYQSNAGQSNLGEVSDATGGKSFWQGTGNPVSLQPYFDELNRRLQHQYELTFTSPLKGKPEIVNLKLKLSLPGAEVRSPQQVLVSPAAQM